MSDGKIYIVITEDLPKEKQVASKGGSQTSQKNNQDDLTNHLANSQIISAISNVLMQQANYQISNVGNLVGDYITQTHINDSMNNLGKIASIGASIMAGMYKWGLTGGITMATIGVLGALQQNWRQIHTNQLKNTELNYEIAQLRDRAGLNSLKDGSRGTEN